MDQVYVIRHKVLVEGRSVREVAREMGISRNTIKRYIEGAEPGRRKPTVRERPVLSHVRDRAEQLLTEAPRWTGGKQRLTAARLHRMLREEGFDVGETLVKRFVREWKRQRQEVFVPLVYLPGDLAEVDFFEVLVETAGVRQKAWMFVMRLMHSGRDFAWLYDRQDQVCFLDGHVRAFAHFGAVPHRLIYDNLKPAVAKILVGAERVLTARFEALATHYVFEPCFARPATGSDKGGVEARGRGIRLQELVPIPRGESLASVAAALLERLAARAADARDAAGRSIAERFELERGRMLPLPEHAFRAARLCTPVISGRALAQIDGAYYSVWSDWAKLQLNAYVFADRIEIVGPDCSVVSHPRKRFGERSVDYRHYVRELARKPQALRQVSSELIPALGPPFTDAWSQLVDDHGPRQAARVFARVLSALETLGEVEVRERVRRALDRGEPLHLALQPQQREADVRSIVLPDALRGIEVVAASAADFDALLLAGGAR